MNFSNIDTSSFQFVKLQEVSSATNRFKVYPNPTSAVFTVSGLRENTSMKWIHVYDSYGKLLISEEVHDNSKQFTLDEPSGIYILELISTDGKTNRIKLLKQ